MNLRLGLMMSGRRVAVCFFYDFLDESSRDFHEMAAGFSESESLD